MSTALITILLGLILMVLILIWRNAAELRKEAAAVRRQRTCPTCLGSGRQEVSPGSGVSGPPSVPELPRHGNETRRRRVMYFMLLMGRRESRVAAHSSQRRGPSDLDELLPQGNFSNRGPGHFWRGQASHYIYPISECGGLPLMEQGPTPMLSDGVR